jgi:hypothetical protein
MEVQQFDVELDRWLTDVVGNEELMVRRLT